MFVRNSDVESDQIGMFLDEICNIFDISQFNKRIGDIENVLTLEFLFEIRLGETV